MTRGNLRRSLVLAAAAAGVAIALVALRDDPAPGRTSTLDAQTASAAAAGETPVADVKLELLEEKPAEWTEAERNPFRFEARRAQAPSRDPVDLPPPVVVPQAPVGPPPRPVIPLRFIGLVDAPTQAGRVAILSDGRGNVFHGREGDIIEGRYRVLKISPDVAELAYLDGQGRQTIRLSGQ